METKSSDFNIPLTTSPILVTGATGFIAGHLILQLLNRGYKVRGTVRDLSKPESFAYLSKLHNAAENLQLVELNLLNPVDHKSWIDVFDGVEYIMHVASPNTLLFDDAHSEILDPAILGTQTILQHCHRSPTLKKIIMTSCMCAITDEFEPNRKYSEQDWNETASETSNVYSFSKVSAEREAVTSASREGTKFSLVTILPGTVLGPHLGGHISFSHRFLLNFMQEKSGRGVINLSYAISDVRDVARFHIAAMEQSNAVGRYICANNAISLQKILQIIHENFSDMNVSKRPIPDVIARMGLRTFRPEIREFLLQRLSKPPVFSKSRMKQLNIPLRTPAETIVDTCRFFIDSNIVSFMDETHASCIIL
mmetsp:Transcript_2119/g.2077  ORF Transcript_2119/g.2077 Transcript_2119/m.2077 type:complete len:366 (-) Transcript_2119:118-1215(-)